MDPEVPHVREVLEFALAVALVVVPSVVVAGRLMGPTNEVQPLHVHRSDERVVVAMGTVALVGHS